MRKQLSSGEWGVLNALWRAGKRASVDDVRSKLKVSPERDYRTIQTILHRCAEKGWVKLERDGGRCYYTAAITRQKGAEERTTHFLSELAEDDLAPLEAARIVLERQLKRLKDRRRGGGKGVPDRRTRR